MPDCVEGRAAGLRPVRIGDRLRQLHWALRGLGVALERALKGEHGDAFAGQRRVLGFAEPAVRPAAGEQERSPDRQKQRLSHEISPSAASISAARRRTPTGASASSANALKPATAAVVSPSAACAAAIVSAAE